MITGTEIPGARDRRRAAPGQLSLDQPVQPRSSSAASAEARWPTPLIRVVDLRRSYALGDVTVHALRGVDARDRGAARFLAIVGRLGLAASRR